MQTGQYVVYGMRSSGNCYKVRLALEQLKQPYRWVEVNSAGGETRTPEFLSRNPNGKVPLLETGTGKFLAESNAILCYLADGSDLLPTDRWQRAQALQWMFFEQYSHEPYVAVARFIMKHVPATDPRHRDLPRLRDKGHQAFGVMERHLRQQPYFAGDAYSVADIALYAYTHVAADGGFDLAPYPAIRDWLGRVETRPGFVSM